MIRVIDLFCGIGGIRKAAKRVLEGDMEVVFSSEIDKFARSTYTANFNEKPAGDITKIAACDIPDFDLLLAGFPCQPFSNAGLKEGFQDTRGTLFYDVMRVIKHHRPSNVLLENVRGLVGHDKGRTLRTIISSLEEEGYNVQYRTLNSADFGLAQSRIRIYIVATLDKVISWLEPPKHVSTCVGDILEDEDTMEEKYYITDKMWAYHKERKKKQMAKGNGFGYSLFTPESKYTNTISARYYKDGSEALIRANNNKNPRRLTPREIARLQGFEDSFELPCSNTQSYKQLGNSVAIDVVEYVVRSMYNEE